MKENIQMELVEYSGFKQKPNKNTIGTITVQTCNHEVGVASNTAVGLMDLKLK